MTRLDFPQRGFVHEVLLLKESFSLLHCTDHPERVGVKVHRYSREQCVIRLQDAWSRFCRAAVIESAIGCTTAGGTQLPAAPNITKRADVMVVLRSTYTGRARKAPWWEPRWHDARQCIEAADRLGIANFGTFSSAIGVTPSPLEDIRAVRNFIAHRCRSTSLKLDPVRQLYGATGRQPDDLLFIEVNGTSVFEFWLDELISMSSQAVQ